MDSASPIRVVMSSYGSEGDSTPLIALARRMQDHGDHVTLLLEADGAAAARDRGLDARALAGDLRAARAAAKPGSDPTLGMARRHLADWARQTRDAIEQVGADVVLGSGLGAEAVQVAARAAGRPFVGVTMFPIVPTAAYSSPLALLAVPRSLNRATHRLIQHLLWSAFGHQLRPLCREWGMSLPRLSFVNHPTLCAASPTLLPEPADWPSAARMVGDLREAPGDLDPDLAAFVERGPAPVYIGFGSMSVPDPDRVRDAVVGLARTRRVVFSPGWSGIEVAPGPNLHVIGRASHDALFPRMGAVVHHGGAGTLHAAARAGVPQVIVPLGGDQAWWADRARDAGIADAPLGAAGLDAAALERAVATAESLRPRAHEVARAMIDEDGCGVVDRILHRAAEAAGPAGGDAATGRA